MKFFKNEEKASIARTLSNMTLIYNLLGKKKKALDMNQKVYGKQFV